MVVPTMTINKVTNSSNLLPRTLLDLTNDSVNEQNLSNGETAHNNEGEPITGVMAILDAEAYARGTRNGVEVGEDDKAYHNNALYYSVVSGSAMRMAGQSAEAAATNAANAEKYALDARSYARGDAEDDEGNPHREGQETDNGLYYLQQTRELSPGGFLNVVAYTEASEVATKEHVTDNQFVYGGQLYTATDDIAIGDTIEPGTNCELSSSLVEQISDINMMINSNRFFASINDEEMNAIADDDGTIILGDWEYQIV